MYKKDDYLNILRDFKEKYGVDYGIINIGLFGSIARDEHTETSDVDVLVEAPEMDLFLRISLKNKLEAILGVNVDVVRKSKYMNQRFKTRIEKEVIYVW